ncbi:MAG: TonB-dependent receptor [Marinicella sp.]
MNKPQYWLWVLVAFCLSCLSRPCYPQTDSRTISQWIEYFSEEGVTLFYSNDYLSDTILNQPLALNPAKLNTFNTALKRFNLQLDNIDGTTTNYVIRPMTLTPQTTLLIKAIDQDTQNRIHNFTLQQSTGEKVKSKQGTVVLHLANAEAFKGQISASGYIKQNIEQTLNNKTSLVIAELEPLPLALSDIHVSTSLTNFNNSNSQQSLTRQDLNQQITLNSDPLRATERLAGTTNNGINGKFSTRGGLSNESLILFDNHELRNPYHFKDFFSLFSTINDAVVDSLSFYKGVFPVKYGGRLSAVLDIQSNQWSALPKHEIELGLLTTSYTFRDQNQPQNADYLFSLRSGGQFINSSLIEDLTIKPEFDDAYFKTTQFINERWQMSQHLLVSRDEIAIDQEDETAQADYHDQNLWLQWFYDDLNQHQMNWQVYGSRRHDRRYGALNDDNSQAFVDEEITSHFQGIKFEHQWQYNDQLLFEYGLDLTIEYTRIASSRMLNHQSELTDALGLTRSNNRTFLFDEHGLSFQAFANIRYQLNSRWVFDLGAHQQHQKWSENGGLSPRFNVAFFSSDRSTWRLGIGRHQQAQHIDELLFEDMNPQYFKPASADLAVLEFNHHFVNNLTLRSEIYHKKYSQTHPYYENLFNGFHVLPDLFYDRIRITPNDAKASGAEFTLSGKMNQIDWSASYVYSDVKDEFDQQHISRSWNQRNAFKLYMGMPIKAWRLDLSLDFHNGWPLTTIETTENGYQIATRNQGRYHDFYQLNLKLNRKWQNEHAQWQLEIQLNNALNRENPCCRNYQFNDAVLEHENEYGLPLVPNISFKMAWD